ncbi:MAG: GHKL domain-containing protein [Clostridiales Family XIII bacterium]|nr:GHKL domain-containing protein [Clostridiales Family XIII bacterium]
MSEQHVYLIFECMQVAVATFAVYMFHSGCIPRNARPWPQRAAAYCAFALLFGFFSLALPNMIFLPAVTFLGVAGVSWFTCKAPLSSHLFLAFMYLLAVLAIDILLSLALSAFFSITLAELHGYGSDRLLGLLLTSFLNIPAVKLLVALLGRHKESFAAGLRGAVPLVLCQAVLILIAACVFVGSYRSHEALTGPALATIVGATAVSTVILWHYDALLGFWEQKRRRETEALQLADQMKYYGMIREHTDTLRALEHDAQKHLSVLEGMILAGEKEKAAQYLSSFSESIKNAMSGGDFVVDTPDPVVSTILSGCVREAADAGVSLEMDISIVNALGIDGLDITVMLGNTISNAFEALAALHGRDEKRLSIRLAQSRHYTLYEITNTFDPSARGKRCGGYGLRNVEACVAKYGGTFSAKASGDTFTATMLIPYITNLSNL